MRENSPTPADVLEKERPAAYVDPEIIERENRRWTPKKIALWVGISLLGAISWFMLALVRGETVNGIWFVFAAVCSYLIAYRFYARFIEAKLANPDDRRATPAEKELEKEWAEFYRKHPEEIAGSAGHAAH